MNKNKKKQRVEETSPLEQEILAIMENALKNSQLKITKKDVQIIVHEIMPDLDEMISKKIKNHFIEIGEFLLDKFKTEE